MVKAEISIKLLENGQLGLNGPLADKVLCLGMLELAKEAVHRFDGKSQEVPSIVLARAIPNVVNGQ